MKRLISIFLTLLVLLGINYFLAKSTNTTFIDFSFAVGFILSVLVWFFTSKGGFTSQFADTMIQGQTTNFKMKQQRHKFSPNIVFLTTLTYTIVSLIITIIYYWEYF